MNNFFKNLEQVIIGCDSDEHSIKENSYNTIDVRYTSNPVADTAINKTVFVDKVKTPLDNATPEEVLKKMHPIFRESSSIITEEMSTPYSNGAYPGNAISKNGTIVTDSEYGNLIPGLAFAYDENGEVLSDEVFITPTSTNGFRYVKTVDGPEDNSFLIKDAGPVNTATVVGDMISPTAVLIPLNNIDAVQDGIGFLNRVKNTIESKNINSHNNLPNPFYK